MNSGRIVGSVVFVAAVAAVCFWPEAKSPEKAPDPVRPVRFQTVKLGSEMPDLTFAGIVKARASRNLRFKQSGRIQRIPVAKGQKVKAGEKLAWLDPQDFDNRLAQAEAAVKRDRLTFQRLTEASRRNAVSKEEVSRAEAQLHHAEAAVELARRARAETELLSPFDGTVASVPATELDMVDPSTPILTVHDTSSVDIEVTVAERFVISSRMFKDVPGAPATYVTFDSYPAKSYPVTFVEYQASADPRTQTFLATFHLNPPDNLELLPGMSATVTQPGASYALKEGDHDVAAIVGTALGIGADGAPFVWTLVTAEDGTTSVRRRAVTVVSRSDSGVVVKGLASGERIATAGVSLLSEGQRVTLMK